jgi:hypothetical protein
LVRKAEDWHWSILGKRHAGDAPLLPKLQKRRTARHRNWAALVNEPQTETELAAVRVALPPAGQRGAAGADHEAGGTGVDAAAEWSAE